MGRASLLVLLVCGACANNVPQDRSTGPDGKIKGAIPIAIDDGNEGKGKGIVTYPGGDRVDWKKIVLPEKQRGKLDLQMTYTTPRPGLRVTFDVFDQFNTPVRQAALGKGREKSMSIPSAEGTYFVRVYAPRRGDAGAYKLVAAFAPEVKQVPLDVGSLNIPPPPRLPPVPEPAPTSCPQHDPTNPTCADVCAPGAPANWPKCLPPPVEKEPPPPPVVVKAPDPVPARVLKTEIQPDGSINLTISAGTEMGVAKTWRGHLLKGSTQLPLSGGGMEIIHVTKRTTLVRVRLTSDIVTANQNVILEP